MNLKRMLVWTSRLLDTGEDTEESVRTDLVQLIDFDVEIALQMPEVAVNGLIFNEALRDVVTDWMNDSFESKSLNQGLIGNQTTFQTVALSPREGALQDSLSALVTASFTGVSLWERRGQATSPINPELVELIQRATLLEDNRLLTLLQAADDASGLGSYVLNARATIPYINPDQNLPETTDDTDNLEIIIIIAIVVACLAFCLLMFAVLWAWKTDHQKQQAYGVHAVTKGSLRAPDNGTGSTSDDYEQNQNQPKLSSSPNHHHQHHLPPSEIQPQEYPESVISEDISQSLTAYYKSGMAGYNVPRRELNDAASMSSMDSYGYSLDGYAPSLSGGPTQMGYPVGSNPRNGQIKDPNDTDDAPDPESLEDYTEAEKGAPLSRQEDPMADKV
jgi:hypothetical protein